ncbi:galactokinase [Chitinophaga skermanii]|uniref:Galactokinase n=1 Tax=Chitinophaga skermanii TaxID=331697 RepID=A0A327Q5W6_9BACT|nr:galactokinase [Chitinophaga skermanii]RAI99364.1 galactokinase [Chitinophaga skermanii]
MIHTVQARFEEVFGGTPIIVTSPGRINLIGEHTDYNEGYVLPGAIDKKITYAVALNGTNTCNAYASFNGEKVSFVADEIVPNNIGWACYLQGVVYHLRELGYTIPGFDCVIDGDIPIGAGLSSSAAVEGGLVLALDYLLGLNMNRMDMAKIGQVAEHTFPGVKCGIMDQFANLHGQANKVMLLDCRSLDYEYVPFEFGDTYKIILVNSMVSHSLASSEYNVRRAQCEEGVGILQQFIPGIQSLRDVSAAQVLAYKAYLPGKVFDRCLYVTQENERVLAAVGLLKQNDLEEMGRLMFETHEGLSKLYEVSCQELDFLVETVKGRPEVAGARVMGGGFGGCTINLVKTPMVNEFIAFVEGEYEKKYGKKPSIYVTSIENGTCVQ